MHAPLVRGMDHDSDLLKDKDEAKTRPLIKQTQKKNDFSQTQTSNVFPYCDPKNNHVSPDLRAPASDLSQANSINAQPEKSATSTNKTEPTYGEEFFYDSKQDILFPASWDVLRETLNNVEDEESANKLQEKIKAFLDSNFTPLPKIYLKHEDEIPFRTALLSFKCLKNLHPQFKDRPDKFYETFFSYKWKKKHINPQAYEEYHDLMRCIVGHCHEAGLYMHFDMWGNRPGTKVCKFVEKIDVANKVILVATRELKETYDGDGESVIKDELVLIQRKARGKEHSVIPLLMESGEKIKELLPPTLCEIASHPFYENQKYCEKVIDLLEYIFELNHNDPYLKVIRTNFKNKEVLEVKDIVRGLKELKKQLEEQAKEEKKLLSTTLKESSTFPSINLFQSSLFIPPAMPKSEHLPSWYQNANNPQQSFPQSTFAKKQEEFIMLPDEEGLPVEILKQAKGGGAKAQNIIGVNYYKGKSIAQDYKKAVKWFKKAANQGNGDAQHYLGIIYYGGQGVPVDFEKAVKWFKKAAMQGNVIDQFNLGFMYASGVGVLKDIKEAKKWYGLAANQEHPEAKKALERLNL